MIYNDASEAILFPHFTGGDPNNPATPDVTLFARASDPLVLEQQINTIGQAQAVLGRPLGGIQLGGSGKGEQFAAQLLFAVTDTPIVGMAFALGAGDGIRVFCFKGETPEAINNNKNLALQRALAFTGSFDFQEYRGFELAGSNDGMSYMGLIVVYRGTDLG
jgi:hypothetical protein